MVHAFYNGIVLTICVLVLDCDIKTINTIIFQICLLCQRNHLFATKRLNAFVNRLTRKVITILFDLKRKALYGQ